MILSASVFPLLTAAPVLADEVVGGTVRGTHAASGQHSDQSIDTLLLKLEEQIVAGHTLIPESDNAMETWRNVIAKVQSGSPETTRALAGFAAHLRDRAGIEQGAGRLVTATYLGVFAGMASDLLGSASAPTSLRNAQASAHVAPAQEAAAATPPQPAESASVVAPAPLGGAATGHPPAPIPETAQDAVSFPPTASGAPGEIPQPPEAAANSPRIVAPALQPVSVAARLPPAASAASSPTPAANAPTASGTSLPSSEATSTTKPSVSGPTEPTPDDSRRAAASGANDAHTVAPGTQPASTVAPPLATPPPAPDQAVVALYAARGDQMLAVKDVSAARRFYEYAANAGNPRAAMMLAKTFDRGFLDELGVVGLRPDPTQATAWYRKALELGYHDAEASLRRLSLDAAR